MHSEGFWRSHRSEFAPDMLSYVADSRDGSLLIDSLGDGTVHEGNDESERLESEHSGGADSELSAWEDPGLLSRLFSTSLIVLDFLVEFPG